MAKTKGNTQVQTQSTEIATTQVKADVPATQNRFGGTGLTVSGRAKTSLPLSRIYLYQGTAKEQKTYAGRGFEPGDFIDVLEQRNLGTSIKIMPVHAFARFAQWEKGAAQPIETWENEADVPAEKLVWRDGGPNGKRIPPIATQTVNVVCAVEGEPWPYLVQFKKTSLDAFEKQILPLEGRRAYQKQEPGLYTLSSTDANDDAGNPYKKLTAAPAGNANEQTVAIALKVREAQQAITEAALNMAKAEDGQANSGNQQPVAGGYNPNA